MDAETVDASVIIPCYQAGTTLEAQLDAVLAQECDRLWEIVCVYQPSADTTRQILDRYAAEHSRIRVVDAPERHHPSYAREVGVTAARGDKLLFCDADDVVHPGWVAAMTAGLDDAELVAGALDPWLLNSAAIARSRAELDPVQQWDGFVPHSAGGNMGIRRSLYERIGGFSEEPPALEDTDFTFRAQLDGGATIVPVESAVISYRYRERFREIVAQARSYGRAEVWLRQRYEPRGMPRLSALQLIRGWIVLAVLAPTVIIPARRPAMAWRFGYRIGQLRGMLALGYRPRFPR